MSGSWLEAAKAAVEDDDGASPEMAMLIDKLATIEAELERCAKSAGLDLRAELENLDSAPRTDEEREGE